ncbi:MAG TPA: hypothetical protein DCW87_07200 [Comamonadaceae bacterium]|nr:hypothetical protein [Comamonadaceae bacterium]
MNTPLVFGAPSPPTPPPRGGRGGVAPSLAGEERGRCCSPRPSRGRGRGRGGRRQRGAAALARRSLAWAAPNAWGCVWNRLIER